MSPDPPSPQTPPTNDPTPRTTTAPTTTLKLTGDAPAGSAHQVEPEARPKLALSHEAETAGPFAFPAASSTQATPPDAPASLPFPGVTPRDASLQPDAPPPLPSVGLYDAHIHTPLCQHATGTLTAYAAVARRRGLAGLTVTCHNPMPDGYAADMRMAEDQLDEYVATVDAARAAWEGKLDIRLGLEADYVPGMELHVEKQLADHEFDFVLGSVHPQVAAYQAEHYRGDTFEFQQTYFRHLADSAETGLFDSLAHPDLIKQLMPRRWSVSDILDDVCHSLDRIARTGVAMEFNTSGWRKPLPEPCPGPRILYEMARRRIPVTLGSDAHHPRRVAFQFEKALRLLEAAGYRHLSVFHQRRRLQVPLADAAACLIAAPAEVAAPSA